MAARNTILCLEDVWAVRLFGIALAAGDKPIFLCASDCRASFVFDALCSRATGKMVFRAFFCILRYDDECAFSHGKTPF